ncbi:hypothetical protein LguiA_026474 [Lonicera macranthoides]
MISRAKSAEEATITGTPPSCCSMIGLCFRASDWRERCGAEPSWSKFPVIGSLFGEGGGFFNLFIFIEDYHFDSNSNARTCKSLPTKQERERSARERANADKASRLKPEAIAVDIREERWEHIVSRVEVIEQVRVHLRVFSDAPTELVVISIFPMKEVIFKLNFHLLSFDVRD